MNPKVSRYNMKHYIDIGVERKKYNHKNTEHTHIYIYIQITRYNKDGHVNKHNWKGEGKAEQLCA